MRAFLPSQAGLPPDLPQPAPFVGLGGRWVLGTRCSSLPLLEGDPRARPPLGRAWQEGQVSEGSDPTTGQCDGQSQETLREDPGPPVPTQGLRLPFPQGAWRRRWQPTAVSLPGESHGQRSLAGYSPEGLKELDTTEWLMLSLSGNAFVFRMSVDVRFFIIILIVMFLFNTC